MNMQRSAGGTKRRITGARLIAATTLCAMFLLIGCGLSVEAGEPVSDQATLAKTALEAKESEVRRAAVERLTDQALLAKVAVEAKDVSVRTLATAKVTNQTLLAKIALGDRESEVRRAAVERLTDQALLAKVAVEAKGLDVRVPAIEKVTNQTLLRQWAGKDPQAAIRQAAVTGIGDDRFLGRLLQPEPSAAVRVAIVKTLRAEEALRDVALTAYYQEDRDQALQRLRQAHSPVFDAAAAAHAELRRKVEALAVETDDNKLLVLAIEGNVDVLRAAAARRLSDPVALEQVALHADDREVLKILLAKLNDTAILNRIAAAADDRPMRLAAARKAEARSWRDIFDAATAKGATVERLGDALAAVSLFSEVQPEAVDGVQHACLNLIRRGDESRIPEMVDLLEGYGDKTLAEDYLNCGQPDLDAAGRSWAQRRGYTVNPGPGSHRARWGSGR